KRARRPRHLAGPLAGLPRAPLRRRRPHPPGPPLQVPPRAYAHPPPHCPRRLLPPHQPSKSATGAREPRHAPLPRTRGGGDAVAAGRVTRLVIHRRGRRERQGKQKGRKIETWTAFLSCLLNPPMRLRTPELFSIADKFLPK